MEIFNVKRRDILNFDNYMDLKKPGFGGPNSAEPYVDTRGKRIKKEPKLNGYQRTVKRDPLFNHEVYNPTYKAMGGDLVHKQTVGKNPYTYPDSYSRMGIPVVQVGSIKEGRAYSFFQFINEEDERVDAFQMDPNEFEEPYNSEDFEDADNQEEYDFAEESSDLTLSDDKIYAGTPSGLSVDEIERKLRGFE